MTGFLVFVRTICYLCSVVRIILVMRKLLLFLVLAAMSIASQNIFAQDRVKEIRKMYADALQDLNAMKEEPHQVNTVEIRNTATEGGVGIVEETTTFYSYHTENMSVVTDGGNDFYSLFFARTKRDYKEAPAQGVLTSEYLFDTETGNLVFCFKKTPGYEDSMDMYQEERFYFNDNGTLCTSNAVVKQKKDNSKVTEFVANEEEILRESLRLMNLFNSIRNRGLEKQFEQSVTSSSDLGFFELNGPVKHVRYENGDELSFDKNGTLVLRNGVNPFRASGPSRRMIDPEGEQLIVDVVWMQRNAQGQICSEYFLESATDYEVGADGRKLKEESFGEGYGQTCTYQYDEKNRLIRIVEQEIDFESGDDGVHKPIGSPKTLTFRYTKTDGHGNWTERETSDGNTVKRTIEYMENIN